MAYEVFLRREQGDLSLDDFLDFFSKRNKYRVDGKQVLYENEDTGVGFCFSYCHESGDDKPSVQPDGVYQIMLSVEYCQPTFFFVEALYELYDLVQNHDFVVYDPQLGKSFIQKPLDDKAMFDSWMRFNIDAVYEYMASLGADVLDMPVMPYDTIRGVWEWNYNIERLRNELGEHIQIPCILPVEYEGSDLTAVVWREDRGIAVPWVDLVIFVRGEDGAALLGNTEEKSEFCIVDFDQVRLLIDQYSQKNFADAFILDYEVVPEGVTDFIRSLDPSEGFTLMDMCDVLEFEIVEEVAVPGSHSDMYGDRG
ncbi:MAG: hypothetical protein ACLFP8_01040 [Alphaproteobacteria bacterium]